MKRALVWLQNNLRLQDNPSLSKARQQADEILLLYLVEPTAQTPWARGAASLWWLQQSLQQLAAQCAEQGLVLNVICGQASELIPQLVTQYQITHVCWQQQWEPRLYQRDLALAQQLSTQGIQCRISADGLLNNPNQLLTQQGSPYRVFTPFYRQLLQHLAQQPLTDSPPCSRQIHSISLPQALPQPSLTLLPPHRWQQKLHTHQQPGELNALARWTQFLTQAVADYPQQRDFPAQPATACLSAALHFGEISSTRLYRDLLPLLAKQQAGAIAWLRQLIWREFARYTLWYFPYSSSEVMDKRFSADFWVPDAERLTRWQQGETGVDMIDAGMHQLWQTGWMHNRVRMLVASFLCKNLQQPWLAGARWFWDTLVDADLANNSMGWQWVAGCGVDAAPYYRIFNPATQSQKFDPCATYIKRWLPPGKRPAPIVDLKTSRAAALACYQHRLTR